MSWQRHDIDAVKLFNLTDMQENVELKLIGITYNQIESGVYALILEDISEGRRLAIVIGYPEAQSIECHLQKVRTPRPLAHDLMASMLQTLNATLLRVDIHRLPTGPYAGKLTVEDALGNIKEIDARSSDAIALAIRVGAPIFTTRELLDKKGYSPKNNKVTAAASQQSRESLPNDWRNFSDGQLAELLQKYVNEENYEEAAEVKREIERRNGNCNLNME